MLYGDLRVGSLAKAAVQPSKLLGIFIHDPMALITSNEHVHALQCLCEADAASLGLFWQMLEVLTLDHVMPQSHVSALALGEDAST